MADAIGAGPAPRSFLRDPYLVLFAVYLLTMMSMDLRLEAIAGPLGSISTLAVAIRWPLLGAMGVVGVGSALARRSWSWTASAIPLVILILLAGLSSIYSSDRSYSFQRAVSIGLLFGSSFLAVTCHCRRSANAVRFTDMYWSVGMTVVLLGFAFGDGFGTRFRGLHGAATGAGGLAAILLPLTLYLIHRRLRGAGRLIGWLALGLLFLQLVLSAARTAIGATLLANAALALAYFGRRAVFAVLVTGILVLVPAVASTRFVERLEARSQRLIRSETIANFTGRLERWQYGLEVFKERPVLGHGFGVSRSIAKDRAAHRFDIRTKDFTLHSDQIEVLVDLGVIGFLVFGAFWGSLFLAGARVWLDLHAPDRELALAYGAILIYLFIDTFMHGGFLSAGNGYTAHTWALLAAFSSLCSSTRRRVTEDRPEPIETKASPGTLRPNRPREAALARLPSIRQIRFPTGSEIGSAG